MNRAQLLFIIIIIIKCISISQQICLIENKRHLSCTNTTSSEIDEIGSKELYTDIKIEYTVFDKTISSIQKFSKITTLSIYKCKIEQIEENAFSVFDHLTEIDFRENNITHINSRSLTSIKQLQRVIFINNRIGTASINVLSNIKRLHTLKLSGNQMTPISIQISGSASTLYTVWLTAEDLSAVLHADFDNSTYAMKFLDLSDNRFLYIEENVFERLTEIEILNLANNQLQNLHPNVLRANERLQYLNLDGNRITSVSRNLFGSLNQLISLSMWNNDLYDIDGSAFVSLSSLKELYLSANKLSVLPVDLFRSQRDLLKLSFWDNRLKDLNEQIFWPLVSIQTLILKTNRIASFPAEIFKYQTRLLTLDVAYNRIQVIDEQVFAPLVSLQELDLTGNELVTIPSFFPRLLKLRTLTLAHNRITHLPIDSITKESTIESLDIGFNRFDFLDVGFFRRANFKRVILGGNPWQCACLDSIFSVIFAHEIVYDEFFDGKRPSCLILNNDICVENASRSQEAFELFSEITKTHQILLEQKLKQSV